jgi:hypothetical protein
MQVTRLGLISMLGEAVLYRTMARKVSRPMHKPQYAHFVAEHSVRASRAAAFEVLCELDFTTPNHVSRTVCGDEGAWRRVWRLGDAPKDDYAALSAHVVAGPDTHDSSADDIDLLLIASVMRERTVDSSEDDSTFEELATATGQFASRWAERLS